MGRTLIMPALTRLLLPHSMIPATASSAAVAGDGRERGLLAGANMLMPTLSSSGRRGKHMLCDGKIHGGAVSGGKLGGPETADGAVGCEIVTDRADFAPERRDP